MEQMTAEQALEAAKGITFEKAWAILQEDHRKWEAERRTEMDKFTKNIDKFVGGLSNSLGELTEAMFSGTLVKKFAEYGYDFVSQCRDIEFHMNDDVVAEADIWLENGDYVLAAEIKTRLGNKDVHGHIERLGRIRRYMDGKKDRRILLGAMAAGVAKKEALQYAHGNGMYVIMQSGENVEIAKPPKGFKAREW